MYAWTSWAYPVAFTVLWFVAFQVLQFNPKCCQPTGSLPTSQYAGWNPS